MSITRDTKIDQVTNIIIDDLGMGPAIKGFDAQATAGRIVDYFNSIQPATEARKPVSMTLKLDTSELQRALDDFKETVKEFTDAVAALPSEDAE